MTVEDNGRHIELFCKEVPDCGQGDLVSPLSTFLNKGVTLLVHVSGSWYDIVPRPIQANGRNPESLRPLLD